MSSADHFPYFAQGTVVSGFRRGSTELGIPTANFSSDVVSQLPKTFVCGVYYGLASIDGTAGVHKMVLSVGQNVYYGCDVKTMETHIMQKFDTDFYGQNLKLIILGFIRPMCNFDSLDGLISAIHRDIQYADKQLEKPEEESYKEHQFFKSSTKTTITSATEENQFFSGCVKNQSQSKIVSSNIAVNHISNGHLSLSGPKKNTEDTLSESRNAVDEKTRVQI